MNQTIRSIFWESINHGDFEDVQSTFQKYHFIKDETYFDYELLKVALNRDRLEIANFLLTVVQFRVRNPNEIVSNETALHLAMKLENTKFIEEILRRGGSLHDKNANGETAVCAFYKLGQYNAVNTALNYFYLKRAQDAESIPNPNLKDDVDHFQIACILNNVSVVEHFLECGFDPNLPFTVESDYSILRNPLHYAIDRNLDKLLAAVLKHGGNLSLNSIHGLMPLHYLYYTKRAGTYLIKQAFHYGNDTKFFNKADCNGISNFLICCTVNAPEIVQAFIDLGADVNSAISSTCSLFPNFTALHLAVHFHSVEVVEVLLRNGADHTRVNQQGATALHLACEDTSFHNRLIIQSLLNFRANPNALDYRGLSPLHIAFCKVDHVHSNIIDKLIEATPRNINYTTHQGLSYFHIVCTRNDLHRIDEFIKSGVDINSYVTAGFFKGYRALHFAVLCNQKEVVKFLLQNGAQINVHTGEDLLTPLHLACNDFVKYRVWNSADSTVSNFMAICYDTFELDIVKILLEHGADVDARDHFGRTPLLRSYPKNRSSFNIGFFMFAGKPLEKYTQKQKEIIKTLLEYNANVNAQSFSKETILHISTKSDRLNSLTNLQDLQEYLIKKGADVNIADENGLTPLHVAVKSTNSAAVQTFLKYRANVNAKTNNHFTPLQIAIDQYRETDDAEHIICLLLEYGADVNMRSRNGKTILHNAIDKRQVYIVEKLLDHGADINVDDLEGNPSVASLLSWDVESIDHWNYNNLTAYRTFAVVFTHIQALLALGRRVNLRVGEICYSLFQRYQAVMEEPDELVRYGFRDFKTTYDECVREIETLKQVRLNNYVSMYNILMKDAHDLSKNLELDKLIELMDNINSFDFPMYYSTLQATYKKALIRLTYLESADVYLRFATNYNLPEPSCDLILKCLRNEDLDNLKKAVFMKNK